MTRTGDSDESGGSAKPTKKGSALVLTRRKSETKQEALAAIVVEGVGMNAVATYETSRQCGFHDADLTEIMAAITKEGHRVAAGDLGGLEAILVAQSVTLNAVFTRLATFAGTQTGLDVIDRTMRLALRAQGHCRATIEALALMKNPQHAVFAKQANIAHGPQQVNNGSPFSHREQPRPEEPVPVARARETEVVKNRLLESHGEPTRVDARTPRATATGDTTVAPVGKGHRPADGRG